MPNSKFEKVKLNNLIDTQINTQKIANKSVNFSFFPDEKNVHIMCDYDQISRLLMNILKNSVESLSKKEKKVHIYLFKKVDHVLIDIEDNGTGFQISNRETFFEPYMKKKINGTGLGLAICENY